MHPVACDRKPALNTCVPRDGWRGGDRDAQSTRNRCQPAFAPNRPPHSRCSHDREEHASPARSSHAWPNRVPSTSPTAEDRTAASNRAHLPEPPGARYPRTRATLGRARKRRGQSREASATASAHRRARRPARRLRQQRARSASSSGSGQAKLRDRPSATLPVRRAPGERRPPHPHRAVRHGTRTRRLGDASRPTRLATRLCTSRTADQKASRPQRHLCRGLLFPRRQRGLSTCRTREPSRMWSRRAR